ncbi:MAG: TatD family hydrolase, partial [Euryarchaeota archaeon]|nr:TatD family hydrolase [Euryarchaeota archaeon]
MKLIDTHIHLDFKNFQRDRSEVIARAQKAGLVALINSGASLGGNRKTIDLVDQYPGFIFATLGYHPTQVVTSEPKDVDQALIFVEQYKTKIVGIGETGLDYYHVKDSIGRHRQKEVFEKFIFLANKFNLPLVIHSRDAEATAFDIVKKAKV